MGFSSRSGRARANASNPEAFAVCQRCGIWYNYNDLRFQYDWRGASMANLFLRVCPRCTDVPQEQLRAIVVAADPVPKVFATVEPYLTDETDYRTISTAPIIDPNTGLEVPQDNRLVSQDGDYMTLQPIGHPSGLDPNAVMPQYGKDHYGVVLQVGSVIADVIGNVTVVTLTPHNLMDNSQVSILQLSDQPTDGFYSVTVLNANAFTFTPVWGPPVGSLLTPNTRIITAKVGLPRGYDQIPPVDAG